MKKTVILLLVFALLLSINTTAFATDPTKTASDFDPAEYTNEALIDIRDEIYAELVSRREGILRIGEPVLISTEDGEYYFTIDNAHFLPSDDWMRWAEGRGEDSIMMSVQGVIENISCDDSGKGGIFNLYIEKGMLVEDQDGFVLEILNVSGGDDGRYQVGAKTSVGEKRRVSLVYYAFTDTESVTVSFKGMEGAVTIPLS